MLYLTCTIISSVDLAHYEVSCVKDWVFVDYGTIKFNSEYICIPIVYFSAHKKNKKGLF